MYNRRQRRKGARAPIAQIAPKASAESDQVRRAPTGCRASALLKLIFELKLTNFDLKDVLAFRLLAAVKVSLPP